MPHRARLREKAPTDIEEAFARNLEWLAKFGPIIPRHMIFVGWDVRGLRYSEIVAQLERWVADGRLVADKRGDYRVALRK